MSTESKGKYRIQLGPAGRELFDSLAEQNAAGLDAELLKLQEMAALVPALEEDRHKIISANRNLADHVGELAKVVTALSTSVADQMHMLDHRTREFEKLLLHISGMVGIHMTDGEESERLHGRLAEIEVELSKQMDKLITLVNDQLKARQTLVQNVVGRAEEERLTIAENEQALSKRPPERGGMER